MARYAFKLALKALASAFVLALVLGTAHAGDDRQGRPTSPQDLTFSDAMLDAARSFAVIDTDDDGLISTDEYAARGLVVAQLARLSRTIRFDGQTRLELMIPDDLAFELRPAERAMLTTVLRREFDVQSLGAGGLTPERWQESRLALFYDADTDGDRTLRGEELRTYLRIRAGDLSRGLASS